MPKTRVLIVDDAVVVRRMVADLLAEDPEIEIAGTAANGQIALAKIAQSPPDLVTLDIEMPVLDGLETLKAIRKTHPRLPVIMFSTLTERGGTATLEALALGASDYVTKPANVGSVTAALQRIREELVPKIKLLCRPVPKPRAAAIPGAAALPAASIARRSPGPAGAKEVLVIGVSTGGPNALAALLPQIANRFAAPILVVQHMPPLFTRLLAERLAAQCKARVLEAVDGAPLSGADIWIAQGGYHLEIAENRRLRLHSEAPENSCRPAADVLFRSAARVFAEKTLAVVLTGMGQDGLRGAGFIREAGGQVLAQDEASSVVWGMPGSVCQAGLADRVLPLSEMPAEIQRRMAGPGRVCLGAAKEGREACHIP